MYHVIRPWEARAFRECRRAWDLGARERQDLEPAAPSRTFDFDEAIHDALEIYYFPGMWDWSRTIVRPLAVRAFDKAMRRQRDAYAAHRELTDAQQWEWQQHLDEGAALLERYFGWAATVDDELSAVQVSVLFDITVPDPTRPEAGLCTPSGKGIWYRVRIELVVTDAHGRCWLVEHRIVPEFSDLNDLQLDEQSLTRAWAWEIGFLGRIEGTIYNELRTGADPDRSEQFRVRAIQGPSGLIKQQGGAGFRRTHIPRLPGELAGRGLAVGHEIMDMTDPGLRLYPNPAVSRCASCAYRAPCVVMNQGEDVGPMLRASFRPRAAQDFEPGRLGSVWGFGPGVNEIDEYRAMNPGNG
ncbi:MAG TPA: hypothetical protein VGM60_00475 [Pseudonocardia sp.]|uniref:hypothetical protein n=1 Tax=Pseudonocardia sp. TaxID=60912 RepID=UPI002F4186FD